MSQTETEYLMKNAYMQYREKQDDGIRGEFQRQALLIESGNQALREELSSLGNAFDSRLANVNDTLVRFDRLNNDVKGGLQQLKDEVGQVKDEVGQVKDEVGQVKDEVGQVKDEMSEIKARLNQLDGRSFNRTRTFPRQTIQIIGIYQPGVGFTLPVYFPATINDFWGLQYPARKTKLIYLLGFYDIQGYQHWSQREDVNNSCGESGSQSDSDDSSPHSLTLEDAVRDYPDIAIDELGSRIGLKMKGIRDFFKRAKQQPQQQPAIKRSSVAIDGPDTDGKQKSKLLKTKPASTHSVESLPEMLQWDGPAGDAAHARLVAILQEAKSHSTESSKDSTTDVMPSHELRNLVVKKGSNKGSC